MIEAEPKRWTGRAPRTERLRQLNAALAGHPDSEAIRSRLRRDWIRTSAVRMLAETGLPSPTGFLREAFQRLVDRFIPHLDESDDLYALLIRMGAEQRTISGLARSTLRRFPRPLPGPFLGKWIHPLD